MANSIHYLGHATGSYNGYNYCSLYLAEKMSASGAHGYVCYKKKYKGDVSALAGLQPGDSVSCTYNRYGDVQGLDLDISA